MVKTMWLLSVAVPSLAKTTDSQVMLQVANLKRGAAIENMHNGVQSMQTRVESMLEQAVTSGDTPELSQSAYDTMIGALAEIEKQLGDEKTANDNDWVEANDAIENCNLDMDKQFEATPDGVNAFKGEAAAAEDAHDKCRGNEDSLNDDELTKHKAMKTQAGTAFNNKPPCLTGQGADETSLAFANRVHTALKKAGQWGVRFEGPVKDANAAFDGAEKLSDAEANRCDDAQGTLETDFCEYEVSLRTTCSAQTRCIKNAKENRAKKKTDLTAKETAEKLILKSCSKVRCYIKLLKNGKKITQAGYDTCKDQEGTFDDKDGTWNSDGPEKLNINWVKEKVEKKCNVGPVDVAPGDAGWHGARYAKVKPTKNWMSNRVGLKEIESCKPVKSQSRNPGGRLVKRGDGSTYPYYGLQCTQQSDCGQCSLDGACKCNAASKYCTPN